MKWRDILSFFRVKGAVHSSLLKPLILPETSCRRSYCCRATSPHAAPNDKKGAPGLRTVETGTATFSF